MKITTSGNALYKKWPVQEQELGSIEDIKP